MSNDQIIINNLSKVFDNGFNALKNINLISKKVKFLQCSVQMGLEKPHLLVLFVEL